MQNQNYARSIDRDHVNRLSWEKAQAKLSTLASMRSGDYVNDYVLSVARHVRHHATSMQECKEIIRPHLRQARPERSDFEIEKELNRQVETAYCGFIKGASDTLRNGYAPHAERRLTWPRHNRAPITELEATGFSLYDLWESSPIRFDDDSTHTEDVIDALFPGNPWLCTGQSNSNFRTYSRRELRGRLSERQLIVPSPMDGIMGITQTRKLSEHTLDNVGPRRFLVIEFDFGIGTEDKQASIIWHLKQYNKLAMVVHSGSKSLHAWFFVANEDDSENSKLFRFMHYAVSLGGDKAGWTKSQFMRMPDGQRDNGNRQTVYYFAPEVVK
jgi:hypothetical protein